jgi:hypothetical protein
MSQRLFIVPINPGDWKNSPSNLKIDPQELQVALQTQWPETEFSKPLPDSTYVLQWTFHHKDELSYLAGLQSDQQCISFGPDAYFVEFSLWYRAFVPASYSLFLTFSAFPETDHLELSYSTTGVDIENYLFRGSKNHPSPL